VVQFGLSSRAAFLSEGSGRAARGVAFLATRQTRVWLASLLKLHYYPFVRHLVIVRTEEDSRWIDPRPTNLIGGCDSLLRHGCCFPSPPGMIK